MASVYGPVYANRRERLSEELDEVVARFNGTPLLFGGDFNVTLEVDDRPDGASGCDQGSEEFWAFYQGQHYKRRDLRIAIIHGKVKRFHPIGPV